MSRKKIIPVPDPEKEEFECPAASWGDMTGLIPYAAEDTDEGKTYDGICHCPPEYGGKN